ncbi:glycine-rich protein [Plantactinospora sp. WMMB334]|uniref:glycine-rich protein n=1 Tax=Plantactinospora sp. WMMB334 TaxID=3404119 RepID=UPI003B9516DB
MVAAPASADGCTTATDFTTAGEFCFRVPAGVQRVRFDVSGAQGGRGGTKGAPGGLGGQVIDEVAVTPGQTFTITVGGFGATGADAEGGGSHWADGGFNGGGRGGGSNGTTPASGGGGGGASDIRSADGNKIIVAGGGGGGGGWGGAATSGPGTNHGGGGGDNVAGGSGEKGIKGGTGGGPDSGGIGGGRPLPAGPGQGNDGECILAMVCAFEDATFVTGGGGGGGGGGWYGGGGGWAGGSWWGVEDGGGGGGGSSYGSATAVYRRGVNSGNGRVRISYFSDLTLSSSANPSVYQQTASFTARVVQTPAAGGVSFTMDGYPICTNLGLVNGAATCSAPANTHWTIGAHEVRVTHTGSNAPTAPAVLSQVVRAQTGLDLKIAELGNRTDDVPTARAQDITLVARARTMGAPIQQPLGRVTFYAGTTKLASVLPASTGDGESRAAYRFNFSDVPVPNDGLAQLRAEYEGTTTTAPVSATLSHRVIGAAVILGDNENNRDCIPYGCAASLTYVGSGWAYWPDRPYGDYGDDVHATTQAGDYVTHSSRGGHRVSLYGERDPYQGMIGIYWGGQLLATVDTSGPVSNLPRQLIWSGVLPSTGSAVPKLFKVVNLSQDKWFTVDQLVLDFDA